jgi:citrate lyase subunit beta / citryl-CoA lyase
MRRSLHFVPGGNERMLAKALTLPADGLILDLEDAVTPDKKAATRPIVRQWLETRDFGSRERWVRMNPIYSEYGESDLEETIGGRPHGYVVPKPRHAGDIRRIVAVLERLEQHHRLPWGSTRLVLIATETPEGLLNIREVAAASPRIAAVSWGIEDLSAAMGLPRTRYTDIADLEGLRRECQEGVWMGFSGKISIHPGQIEVINSVFTPSKTDAEEAVALIAAFEEHARRGAGAFAWKGQMMDMPHLTRARKIAERARQAGVI